MSGGYFDGKEYNIQMIIDEITEYLKDNNLKPETKRKFKKALDYLNFSYIYTKRIDYLISGDDGEETFHERLKEDIFKEITK